MSISRMDFAVDAETGPSPKLAQESADRKLTPEENGGWISPHFAPEKAFCMSSTRTPRVATASGSSWPGAPLT
jgi:hypothetical protein